MRARLPPLPFDDRTGHLCCELQERRGDGAAVVVVYERGGERERPRARVGVSEDPAHTVIGVRKKI